ncbi:MAG: DUF134 domain-containing protein [Methanomassiliicoccales archaeon]|nr:DUF134 domain-containing protein [Methanomassiliicoccales archaeon]NYT15039.1 DUF134 domain-containing protein [Methanomassiliicoccales archaeon]
MQYQRGRRRGARWISHIPIVRAFGPLDQPPRGSVQLKFEELEALRLVDLEGMDQEQAAVTMGISRKSLWLDLKRARGKVTEALVTGMIIQVEGGTYMVRGNQASGPERMRMPGRVRGPPAEQRFPEQR